MSYLITRFLSCTYYFQVGIAGMFWVFCIPLSQAQTIAVDDSLAIAVMHRSQLSKGKGNQEVLHNNKRYTIQLSKEGASVAVAHQLMDASGKIYILYLTKKPVLQFYIDEPIVNEPKRMSRLIYTDKDTLINTYAGIELRGSSSLVFPKKTYDINLHTAVDGRTNQNLKFAKMRNDDDWILDAVHNEPLRMRSHLSYQLWKEIHRPYYLDKEPKAEAGVETRYCEVFINDQYKGVYLLSEQVDRKLLKLVKEKDDTTRGELFQGARYLGACTFDSLPEKKNYLLSWGGYDIKYPVPNNTPWDHLYAFTDFVLHSDDTAFAKAISTRFQLENFIDYFLFINALRAPDNLGKNIYTARYNEGEPYFYVPWDLDGTFGTIFNGRRIPTTNDFLTNGLLRRLIAVNPDNFIERFQSRWLELRQGVFETTSLQQRQANLYTELKEGLFYEREQKRWNDFISDPEGLTYMNDWTAKRLLFLDGYIGKLVE